jgi:iron(III) transport system substrate-binding protein
MIRLFCASLFMLILAGCGRRVEQVVLYTSQDQFYAEPILAAFTKETGIEVLPVFDNESAKTAAMAHRLRAEKRNPQCDVFWSNEEMHTHLLVQDGILVSDQVRKAGYRTRQLSINTNLLKADDVPKDLQELATPKWKGKVALAYPLFGTTSFHFLALRQLWGDPAWRDWCSGLVHNGAKVVDGNSVVVKLVGTGECWIGLTDSDDINSGIKQGLPVSRVNDFDQALVISNTIGIVKNAPHPGPARILVEYLSRPDTLQRLVQLGAIEGIAPPRDVGITVDWNDPHTNLDEMNEILKTIFLRS